MQVELQDFKDTILTRELTVAPEQLPVLADLQKQGGIEFIDSLTFRLRLQKVGQIVEVDGSFQGLVRLDCGHCLESYQQPLDVEFNLTYTPLQNETGVAEDEEVELDSDEMGLIFYKDETLELLQPLEEQVVMALPISPLCNQECKGLCSICGCNLNKEKCACEKQPFNNKFAALAGLKLDADKSRIIKGKSRS